MPKSVSGSKLDGKNLKKDPFQKNFVDIALSVFGDHHEFSTDEALDELSESLKLRGCIIEAQIECLLGETEKLLFDDEGIKTKINAKKENRKFPVDMKVETLPQSNGIDEIHLSNKIADVTKLRDKDILAQPILRMEPNWIKSLVDNLSEQDREKFLTNSRLMFHSDKHLQPKISSSVHTFGDTLAQDLNSIAETIILEPNVLKQTITIHSHILRPFLKFIKPFTFSGTSNDTVEKNKNSSSSRILSQSSSYKDLRGCYNVKGNYITSKETLNDYEGDMDMIRVDDPDANECSMSIWDCREIPHLPRDKPEKRPQQIQRDLVDSELPNSDLCQASFRLNNKDAADSRNSSKILEIQNRFLHQAKKQSQQTPNTLTVNPLQLVTKVSKNSKLSCDEVGKGGTHCVDRINDDSLESSRTSSNRGYVVQGTRRPLGRFVDEDEDVEVSASVDDVVEEVPSVTMMMQTLQSLETRMKSKPKTFQKKPLITTAEDLLLSVNPAPPPPAARPLHLYSLVSNVSKAATYLRNASDKNSVESLAAGMGSAFLGKWPYQITIPNDLSRPIISAVSGATSPSDISNSNSRPPLVSLPGAPISGFAVNLDLRRLLANIKPHDTLTILAATATCSASDTGLQGAEYVMGDLVVDTNTGDFFVEEDDVKSYLDHDHNIPSSTWNKSGSFVDRDEVKSLASSITGVSSMPHQTPLGDDCNYRSRLATPAHLITPLLSSKRKYQYFDVSNSDYYFDTESNQGGDLDDNDGDNLISDHRDRKLSSSRNSVLQGKEGDGKCSALSSGTANRSSKYTSLVVSVDSSSLKPGVGSYVAYPRGYAEIPLLSLSRIQSYLRASIQRPPLSSEIRLVDVIPPSIAAKTYPGVSIRQARDWYTRRTFLSLVFAVDCYNRKASGRDSDIKIAEESEAGSMGIWHMGIENVENMNDDPLIKISFTRN